MVLLLPTLPLLQDLSLLVAGAELLVADVLVGKLVAVDVDRGVARCVVERVRGDRVDVPVGDVVRRVVLVERAVVVDLVNAGATVTVAVQPALVGLGGRPSSVPSGRRM